MKRLRIFILILPFVFMSAGSEDVIDRTAELLKDGNAHELAGSFSSNIEITIMGDENVYSNGKAEQALSGFFRRCQPKSVKIIHRIASNVNYRYAVVLLNTSNGAYRTSFSLKNINGKFELDELRIETEKAK